MCWTITQGGEVIQRTYFDDGQVPDSQIKTTFGLVESYQWPRGGNINRDYDEMARRILEGADREEEIQKQVNKDKEKRPNDPESNIRKRILAGLARRSV